MCSSVIPYVAHENEWDMYRIKMNRYSLYLSLLPLFVAWEWCVRDSDSDGVGGGQQDEED